MGRMKLCAHCTCTARSAHRQALQAERACTHKHTHTVAPSRLLLYAVRVSAGPSGYRCNGLSVKCSVDVSVLCLCGQLASNGRRQCRGRVSLRGEGVAERRAAACRGIGLELCSQVAVDCCSLAHCGAHGVLQVIKGVAWDVGTGCKREGGKNNTSSVMQSAQEAQEVRSYRDVRAAWIGKLEGRIDTHTQLWHQWPRPGPAALLPCWRCAPWAFHDWFFCTAACCHRQSWLDPPTRIIMGKHWFDLSAQTSTCCLRAFASWTQLGGSAHIAAACHVMSCGWSGSAGHLEAAQLCPAPVVGTYCAT